MSISNALSSSPIVSSYFGDLFTDPERIILLLYHGFSLGFFSDTDTDADTDSSYSKITNRVNKYVGKYMEKAMPYEYNEFIKKPDFNSLTSVSVGSMAENALLTLLISALFFGYSSLGTLLYGIFVLLKPPGSYLNGSKGKFVTVHKVLQYFNLGSLLVYFSSWMVLLKLIASSEDIPFFAIFIPILMHVISLFVIDTLPILLTTRYLSNLA